MRSEWVPVSAAALVTGVMVLVLAQMLNPGAAEASAAGRMLVAAEHPGRWLAMSVLYFGSASALVLGMPAVMTLFLARRGRGVGITGVAVFTVGCVGVGALSGLMLMFRALALETLRADQVSATDIRLVSASLEEPALQVTLGVWVYGFMLGVLLIAVGLLRSRTVALWVPMSLAGYLVLQASGPVVGEGTAGRVASALALMLLAAGFTGMAVAAASPHGSGTLEHSLA